MSVRATIRPAISPTNQMYYSYDPDCGIEFHDTEEQARDRAEKMMEGATDCAADSDWSWSDSEDEISWGKVMGRVTVMDTPLSDEDRREFPDHMCRRELSLDGVT